MKTDSYPEDSTQSAYSSQLIWIPLSHHFFFFFYLWGFISREATKRQYRGGDQNQLLGEMPADVRKYVSLPHVRLAKLSASDMAGSIRLSTDANFQRSLSICFVPLLCGPTRERVKEPIVYQGSPTKSPQPSPSKANVRVLKGGGARRRAREALDQQNNTNGFFFENVSKRVKEICERQFSGAVEWNTLGSSEITTGNILSSFGSL